MYVVCSTHIRAVVGIIRQLRFARRSIFPPGGKNAQNYIGGSKNLACPYFLSRCNRLFKKSSFLNIRIVLHILSITAQLSRQH